MRSRRWIRFLWYWAPPILWVLAMNLLTRALLSQDVPGWASSNDKMLHGIYFGGFAVLAFRAGVGTLPWPPAVIALAAFMITAGYGAFDEWSQIADPHRVADRRDWFADIGGASLVFPLAAGIHAYRRLRPPPASRRASDAKP